MYFPCILNIYMVTIRQVTNFNDFNTTLILQFSSNQIMLKRNGNHICGGSILTENFVVTAAHCMKNDPSVFSVGYGSMYKYDFSMKSASVQSIHIHPGWQPSRGLSNDIALMRLTKPMELNERTAAPICLPPIGYTPSGMLKVSWCLHFSWNGFP